MKDLFVLNEPPDCDCDAEEFDTHRDWCATSKPRGDPLDVNYG